MPGIVANAEKYVSSYPCSDAHERSSREISRSDIILYVVLVYFILFLLLFPFFHNILYFNHCNYFVF